MNSTPVPSGSPTDGLVINGPLFVFPEGSIGVVLSALALLVSAAALWHTISARSRIQATAVRYHVKLSGGATAADGDEINIINTGRTAGIVSDVRAITANDRYLRAKSMPRGPSHTPVEFPSMPQSIAPGGVLQIWFSAGLAGEKAGVDHGYRVTYIDTTSRALLKGKPRHLVVKASSEVP